jgi:hypothetical protein
MQIFSHHDLPIRAAGKHIRYRQFEAELKLTATVSMTVEVVTSVNLKVVE